MSLPGSVLNGNCDSFNHSELDQRSTESAPVKDDGRAKVDIETFLNGNKKGSICGDSGSVTVNVEEDMADVVAENGGSHQGSEHSINIVADHEDSGDAEESTLESVENRREMTPKSDVTVQALSMDSKPNPKMTAIVSTPTIKLIQHPKPAESQKLTGKVETLSQIIREKDDQIRELAERLLLLEQQKDSPRNSRSSSSSSSSSSLSSSGSEKENSSKSSKSSKKEKKSPKSNKKKKSKKEKVNVNEKPEKKKKEKKPKETTAVASTVAVEPPRSESVPSASPILDAGSSPFRRKIEELEAEVKKLQQANIDSILSLQDIQDKLPVSAVVHGALQKQGQAAEMAPAAASEAAMLNQLIVDHSLLKQELDQLKWQQQQQQLHQQSSSQQPTATMLLDEISQLKRDINSLREQNDLLRQHSLRGPRVNLHTDKERGSRQPPRRHNNRLSEGRSGSADFIVEQLHSNGSGSAAARRRTTGHKLEGSKTAPSVKTLLRSSIDAMDSPYHASCQSMWDPRDNCWASDSSSTTTAGLVEDSSPRFWSRPPQHATMRDEEGSNTARSIASSVTTVASEDDSTIQDSRQHPLWQRQYVTQTASVVAGQYGAAPREPPVDMLSSIDSQVSYGPSPARCSVHQKPGQPFTPKTAAELCSEDTVKFARPGGKMSSGRVCYLGRLPGRTEVCVGLELEEDAGKHDGLFEGIRYFQCRKNRGVFISFHKIILAYKAR